MFREIGRNLHGLEYHESQENKELEEREVNHQFKYCREFEEDEEVELLIRKGKIDCNCGDVDW